MFVQSFTTTYAVNLSTRRVDWSYAAAGSIAIGDGLMAIVDDTSLHVFLIATGPPLPPTGLTAARITGNLLTLRFTPPSAGAVPTSYVLEGGTLPGQVLVSMPLGAAPEHTINAPAGAFYVRVRAVAGGVVSAPSNEIRIFVNQAVPPSPPVSFTGLVSGSSLRLAWKNTFQGGAVDRVILDVTGAVSTSFVLGRAETFAFDGVPPGTYTLSVRAQNAAGTSAPSASVELTFPATCSGVPQVPTSFLTYRVGNVLRASWEPPASGPAPTVYIVDVVGPFTSPFPVEGRSLSGTVGPGTYRVSVAAMNGCGIGAATAVQTVAVP